MKKILILSVLILSGCYFAQNNQDYYDETESIEEMMSPRGTCMDMGVDPDDVNRMSSCLTYLNSQKATTPQPQLQAQPRRTRLDLREAEIPNTNYKIQMRQGPVQYYNQGITPAPQRSPEDQRKLDAINADPSCRTTYINGSEVKRCVGRFGNTICYFRDPINMSDFVCVPEQSYGN